MLGSGRHAVQTIGKAANPLGQYIEPMQKASIDQEHMSARPRWERWIRQLRLPSRCLACQAWPTDRLCADCHTLFLKPHARCIRCALTLPATGASDVCFTCQRHPPLWQFALAAVPYAYPWNQCLAQLKFHQQPGWAQPLAKLIADTVRWPTLQSAADIVVAVPSSPSRLRERGYNHAVLLARHLARGQLLSHALRKIRDTPVQHGLGLAQRLSNLRGALVVSPAHAPLVQGKRVLLIDDVMTSGGTASACTAALLAAGASAVDVAVVARSEPSNELFDTSSPVFT
jgi:ComF family protein